MSVHVINLYSAQSQTMGVLLKVNELLLVTYSKIDTTEITNFYGRTKIIFYPDFVPSIRWTMNWLLWLDKVTICFFFAVYHEKLCVMLSEITYIFIRMYCLKLFSSKPIYVETYISLRSCSLRWGDVSTKLSRCQFVFYRNVE